MKKILFFTLALAAFLFSSSELFSQNNGANYTTVDKVQAVDVNAYPNPADKMITFSFKGIDISTLTVEMYEITGQFSSSFNPQNNQEVIDVSGMKEGIYFYKVLDNGNIIITEKFVIQRK